MKPIFKTIWKYHMKLTKNIVKIMNNERTLAQLDRIYCKAVIIKPFGISGNSFINGTG